MKRLFYLPIFLFTVSFLASGHDASGQGYGFGPPRSNGYYGGLSNQLLQGNHPTRQPNYVQPPTFRPSTPAYRPNLYGYPYGFRRGVRRPVYGYPTGFGYPVPWGIAPWGTYNTFQFNSGLQVLPPGVIQSWGPVFGPGF